MRVISGNARGRKLKSPKDTSIRPTEDRVKENVFNILQGPFYGVKALDLFSGTGSIGIEFLSRGADLVWFNDNSLKSKELILANLTLLNYLNQGKVFSKNYRDLLEMAFDKNFAFDYIYLDPPYVRKDYYIDSLYLIDRMNLLNPEGRLIIEAPENTNFEFPESLDLLKFKKYGSTGIWILKKCEE